MAPVQARFSLHIFTWGGLITIRKWDRVGEERVSGGRINEHDNKRVGFIQLNHTQKYSVTVGRKYQR